MTRLTLRNLTSVDLPFADSLRAIAGWNQTLVDWQRFLDLSPRGCLLAECDGQPVATAVTISYGSQLGWIGMMLVHPDFRRRGIARVLLQHCIEILNSAGVKAIKLDATPAGREVYLNMGFKDAYTLTRYQREGAPASNGSPFIRQARPEDLPNIAALDEAAIGAPRNQLLQRLISESSRAVVYETKAKEISAFGILRPGSRASYLGPIIAPDPAHAQQVAGSLLAETTYCDLPDYLPETAAWAKSNDFTLQRTLTRMYLGTNVSPAAPNSYFAIAAPCLG